MISSGRALRVGAWLAAACVGCHDRPCAPLAAHEARAGIGTGPCAGKQVGERACDGRTLVHCDDAAGGVTALRTCLTIERCDAGRGECVPDCPRGEVFIPATGPQGFMMGTGTEPFGFGPRRSGNEGHGIADLPHVVVLTRPFCMDATEVTVGAYQKCVEGHGCIKPDFRTKWIVYPDKADHPVNMVDFRQARFYCRTLGKSLPTEAQWEWAASAASTRKWPWGDEPPTCDHADYTAGPMTAPACDCGCKGGGASPVGTHPRGDTVWPAGRLHDLAGNVWEWCLDNYHPYGLEPEADPLYVTHEENLHIVRGGGWNRSAVAIMRSFRGSAPVAYQRPALGFRCVRNP